MNKKILISLHNGIGDLVITFPIIQHLLLLGYKITYETVRNNFDLIEYFFEDKIQKRDSSQKFILKMIVKCFEQNTLLLSFKNLLAVG